MAQNSPSPLRMLLRDYLDVAHIAASVVHFLFRGFAHKKIVAAVIFFGNAT